jgi:hypothetical protein
MQVCVLAALAAGLLFASEDQKPSSKQELGLLTILERQVLEAWKTQNVRTLQSLLRDDYVEIAGAGPNLASKMEVLKILARTRITDYSMSDVHLLPLNPNAAVLTYKLTLKLQLGAQEYFANPAYVSSTWVRQDSSWLSVFRQWTPLSKEAIAPPPVTGFEAALTPDTVRYHYKGTTRLDDVHATIQFHLNDGSVSTQDYWATWDPDETKEVSLGFLAFGVDTVQRLELSGTATLAGKKVSLANVARRDTKIPADLSHVPPLLKLLNEK